MPGDGVFRRLRRAVQSARRGAFFGPRQGTAGVPELKHTTDGAGRPPLRGASWDGSHVAFMERRLRRDVLVPKVLGAQVAFAAVMVHIGRGGLDFMIATSAAEADLDAESGGAWPWPRGEARVSSRQVAKGPGPVADAAPALVFVFVVAATWFRSRGTALLHTWRTWQAIGPALAAVYTHVVCVASRCPAALARWLDDEDLAEGEDFAENAKLLQSLQSLAFSVRVVAAVAGETLLADCTRLARGLVPRGLTCVCALAAVYSLEMHASHLQGIGSVIVSVARFPNPPARRLPPLVECTTAVIFTGTCTTTHGTHALLPAFYGVQSESLVPLRNYPIPDIRVTKYTRTRRRKRLTLFFYNHRSSRARTRLGSWRGATRFPCRSGGKPWSASARSC
jgi:hypothetical protein